MSLDATLLLRTSRPVTVLSLICSPVTVMAAYEVPPSATNTARVDMRLAYRMPRACPFSGSQSSGTVPEPSPESGGSEGRYYARRAGGLGAVKADTAATQTVICAAIRWRPLVHERSRPRSARGG